MKNNQSKLFCLINNFFKFTNTLQRLTLSIERSTIQKKITTIKKTLLPFWVTFLIAIFITGSQIVGLLFLITYFCYIIATSLINPSKSFTSLRSFISTGFYGTTIAALLIIGFIHYIVDIKSIAVSAGIFLLLYFSIWIVYSCMANSKVAILGNLFYSTLLSILSLICDTIIDIIPENAPIRIPDYSILNQIYTKKEVLAMGLHFILLPLLIINLSVTMVCALKEYWTKKYNNNDQII